jgi:hypothetical protein
MLTTGILKKMRAGIQPEVLGQMAGEATKGPARKGALVAAGGGALAGHKVQQNRNLNAAYASYDTGIGKADSFTARGEIAKFDTDKRLVFGWANISEINGMPVVDRQGDYIPIDDLENAAISYVLNTRVGGDMHRRTPDDRPHHVSDLVESIVFTPEKVEKMFPGVDPDVVPQGWWVGFKVWDDDAWGLVKKGLRTGFSIHGKGRRSDLDIDELMNYA